MWRSLSLKRGVYTRKAFCLRRVLFVFRHFIWCVFPCLTPHDEMTSPFDLYPGLNRCSVHHAGRADVLSLRRNGRLLGLLASGKSLFRVLRDVGRRSPDGRPDFRAGKLRVDRTCESQETLWPLHVWCIVHSDEKPVLIRCRPVGPAIIVETLLGASHHCQCILLSNSVWSIFFAGQTREPDIFLFQIRSLILLCESTVTT